MTIARKNTKLAQTISVSGNAVGDTLFIPSSGLVNVSGVLTVNNVIVSVSGHSHTSSDITNFNSSVSGLLPTISNSGDNRVLTSTGSSVGINAESNLTFDGSNLGIGTSSPTQRLQIHGSSADDVYLRISNTDTTTASGLLIGLMGTEDGLIRVEPNKALIFGTNNTERMRITSGGNLEIKSNAGNISTLFTYNENGGELVHYDETQTAATLFDQCNNSTRLLELINGSDLVLGLGGSNTTGNVKFMRAGYVEAMRIHSSGTSFYQSANGTPTLGSKSFYSATFENFSTGYGLGIGGVNPANGSTFLQVQNFSSAAAYDLLLQPLGGNVGIGTTSPSVKLDVYGADAAISVGTSSYGRFQTSGGNAIGYMYGSFAALGDGIHLTYNHYHNAAGTLVISNSGGFTSRITAGYGAVMFATSSAANVAPTERMRITSDGNVSIGTTAGSYRLHVIANASSNNNILCYLNNTNGTRGRIAFQDTAVTYAPDIGSVGNSITFDTVGIERVRIGNNGRVQFFAATEKYGFQLNNGSTGNGPFLGSDGADIFTISTAGGAERLRVNASGELLIGTTTDNGAYLLQVNSQIYATNATIATSDSKFKTNITTINNATSIIELLRPVSFDFIPQSDRNFSTDRQIGLIAQEVAETLSNIDYKDSIVAQCGDHFGLAYEKLVPLLIKALQETNEELQNIKNRLSTLEGE